MENVISSLQMSNDLLRQEVIQLNSQIRLTESYLENEKENVRVLQEIIRHMHIKKKEEEEEQSKKREQSTGIYTTIKSYIFG